MSDGLQDRKQDIEQLVSEKDSFCMQLNEANRQLKQVLEDKDMTTRAAAEKETKFKKDINKFSSKLKGTISELTLCNVI